MEEQTRTLLDNGSMRMQSGRYELDKTAETTSVPENIHGVIAPRMDSLEDEVSIPGRAF